MPKYKLLPICLLYVKTELKNHIHNRFYGISCEGPVLMEQVLKNADINILRNFLLIFSNFFLDIEKSYQALSTCQISDQLNYPNRNYKGGDSAPPWPYQSGKCPACLGLRELLTIIKVVWS